MIRGRESSDRWARFAHRVLDRAADRRPVSKGIVNWALAYLGDRSGKAQIPRALHGGHRHYS